MARIARIIGKTFGLETKQLAAKKYQQWLL